MAEEIKLKFKCFYVLTEKETGVNRAFCREMTAKEIYDFLLQSEILKSDGIDFFFSLIL